MAISSQVLRVVCGGIVAGFAAGIPQARAQGPQQAMAVLRVDWKAPEIERFKADPIVQSARLAQFDDKARATLAKLQLPVLALIEMPQLVKKALGANAKLVKPSVVIADPAQPVWYHIVETYGDISVTVDADLRINHVADADFRIQKPALVPGNARQGEAGTVAIFDGAREEGMEGVMAEYTVHRFSDIPYTVTFECRGAAKPACRDRATIIADQKLLQLVAVR
jgi:hypothetical protein